MPAATPPNRIRQGGTPGIPPPNGIALGFVAPIVGCALKGQYTTSAYIETAFVSSYFIDKTTVVAQVCRYSILDIIRHLRFC
jgi:hypothetical protein